MKQKQVQIPEQLFAQMIVYFCTDRGHEDLDLRHAIERGIDAKIDAMNRRDYYTTYKTAESPQEREEARQRYLDSVGMRDSFRWSSTEEI